MPDALRGELLALNQAGADELHRAALAANAISELYADAVARPAADRPAWRPQTWRPSAPMARPCATARRTSTAPATRCNCSTAPCWPKRTGIDVVCDFRSRDVAAGGQGAPLVPAFHAACFARPGADVAVLNLGGIANLTLLRASGEVLGFDCGPGNVLMDLWCRRHRGTAYDDGGDLGGRRARRCRAAGAGCWPSPSLRCAPPKSTGRDLFDAGWLDARLGAAPRRHRRT